MKAPRVWHVEHDAEGEWLQAVREDLWAREGHDTTVVPAVFRTLDAARRFIARLRGVMHMGGGEVHFRMVTTEPPTTSIESQVYIDDGWDALNEYRQSPSL